MINGIITLLVIAVCFYVGILYENIKFLICGLALGILLFLSILEVLYRLFTIQCKVEIPIAMAEKKKPVEIGIRVRNSGGVISGRICLCLKIHNRWKEKGKKNWIHIPHGYSESHRYEIPIVIHGAGCQEIDLKKIRIYSLTGLIYLTKRCKSHESIVVMPEIRPVSLRISEALRNFIGDADEYDEYRSGHDASEIYDIREYREKDKPQSIHWKLSAKMEELVVKENSLPAACAVVVLLEIQKKKGNKNSIEDFLERAAGVSYALMDAGCPHYVAWFSKEKAELTRIRVDDEESFYLFLNIYLQDGIPTADMDLRELYREKYRNEYYLKDLCISSADENEEMEFLL